MIGVLAIATVVTILQHLIIKPIHCTQTYAMLYANYISIFKKKINQKNKRILHV